MHHPPDERGCDPLRIDHDFIRGDVERQIPPCHFASSKEIIPLQGL